MPLSKTLTLVIITLSKIVTLTMSLSQVSQLANFYSLSCCAISLHWEADELISFRFGIFIVILRLHCFTPVWVTLTVVQGQRAIEKLVFQCWFPCKAVSQSGCKEVCCWKMLVRWNTYWKQTTFAIALYLYCYGENECVMQVCMCLLVHISHFVDYTLVHGSLYFVMYRNLIRWCVHGTSTQIAIHLQHTHHHRCRQKWTRMTPLG